MTRPFVHASRRKSSTSNASRLFHPAFEYPHHHIVFFIFIIIFFWMNAASAIMASRRFICSQPVMVELLIHGQSYYFIRGFLNTVLYVRAVTNVIRSILSVADALLNILSSTNRLQEDNGVLIARFYSMCPCLSQVFQEDV